jgi:hypothetical protein
MQRYTIFFIAVEALYMFHAVFPPIIRSSNCTHYIWYKSSLLIATASVGELAVPPETCRASRAIKNIVRITLHLVGYTWRNTLTMHGTMKVERRASYFWWRQILISYVIKYLFYSLTLREEEQEERRKLHDEALHVLCSSSNRILW